MNKEFSQTQFDFTPLLSSQYLYPLIFVGFASVLFFVIFRRKAILPRVIAFSALLLALLNVAILSTTKQSKDGIVLVVADESYSNTIDGRDAQTQGALEYITKEIEATEELKYKIIRAPSEKEKFSQTDLFQSIDKTLTDIPPAQRSGVAIISDGNIHDIPELSGAELNKKYGPIHHIVTGKPAEKDRRLEVKKSPLYGLKGTQAQIDFVVHDTNAPINSRVSVTINTPEGGTKQIEAQIGKRETIYVPVEHAGVNPVELLVEPAKDEISLANNRRAVLIQGVRDKLNVLLVSGAPHEGGRYWRSLLTSDPAIELVHFTILRDIDSRDNTPRSEMALIPFPHQQLFHKQLNSFDLIIFDRYRNQGILQNKTYRNIAQYVRKGGALLISSGPEYMSDKSIYKTPLKDILIGTPKTNIYETGYKPTLTELGLKHPITRDLIAGKFHDQNWSDWLRQIDVDSGTEKTLLSGYNDAPLVMISEKDKGRLIHLASDQIWLWAREYRQGGPYIDLMRKMIHWLLKEPSLEEGQIELSIDKNQIRVKRYTNPEDAPVSYTDPEGQQKPLNLLKSPDGLYRGYVSADKQGLYSFMSGKNKAYIIYGAYDTVEQTKLIRSKSETKPIVSKTGGGYFEANKIDDLNIKTLSASSARKYHSFNTMAFRKSQHYETLKIKFTQLLPSWAYFLIFSLFMLYAWHRESR